MLEKLYDLLWGLQVFAASIIIGWSASIISSCFGLRTRLILSPDTVLLSFPVYMMQRYLNHIYHYKLLDQYQSSPAVMVHILIITCRYLGYYYYIYCNIHPQSFEACAKFVR